MKNNIDGKKLALKGLVRAAAILVFMGIGLYFQYQKHDPKTFNSILASTIISASVAGFMVIYDYDIWSVSKKIIIHTICMFITVIPALMISGWFDLSTIHGYFIMFLSFISFGVVAATIGYIVSKYILKNVPQKTK